MLYWNPCSLVSLMKQADSSLLRLVCSCKAPRGLFPCEELESSKVLSFILNLSLWKCLASVTLLISYWFPFCKGGTIAFPYLFIFLQSLNASKLHFLPLSMCRAIKHRCGWRGGGRIVTVTAEGAIRRQAAFNEIWLGNWFVHHIRVLLNKFDNLSVTVSEHEGDSSLDFMPALFFTSNLQYPQCGNRIVFICD